MAWWIPVLQAIGINAAKNVVTGQDPLKGTIEAGVTGGVLGAFNPSGAVSAGDAAVASNEAAALSQNSVANLTGNVPTSEIGMANTFNTSQGGLLSESPAKYLGSTGEIGSNMGFVTKPSVENNFVYSSPDVIESDLGMAGADGVFRNQDYFANVFGNPIYTGGEGLLSNIGDELKTSLSSITPKNLLGVASLLDQPDTSQYRQMAGTGGGVSRGSGQGLAVEMPQARVFKRRKA